MPSPVAAPLLDALACGPDAALVITGDDAIGTLHVPAHQAETFGGLSVGESVAEARWPAAFGQALVPHLEEVRRSGERVTFDIELATGEGTHLHSVHLCPTGSDVVCIVRDDDAIIDQRMGRDRELIRFAESVDAYVWSATVSPKGEFGYRYYSPTVEKITGYPIEYFMKGPEGWLSTIHPEDRPKLEAAAAAVITGNRDRIVVEYRSLRPDGTTNWLRDHALVVRRPDGSRLLTGFVLDVTARRNLEAEFLQAQKGETLGLLAGGIAHDFNNILTSILVGAEVARRDLGEGHPALHPLSMVVDGAERATALCQQLLAYAGKGGRVTEPVSLGCLVTRMTPMLESLSHGARLEVSVTEEPLVVVGDATQLQQLVLNLVTNAADATGDDGTIAIRVAAESRLEVDSLRDVVVAEGASDGAHVLLEVKDDGAGMSPQTRERMFDPFFSTKDQGHGLGLSAALGIVKMHRGVLQVTSALGEGTTVRIALPRSSAEVREEPADDATAPTGPVASRRVLLIDDESSIRRLATMALEHAGYQVVPAEDGPSGLAYLQARGDDIDLVILDMTMPGMGGEEVLRRIRKVRPGLPVLLSSGHAPGSIAQLVGSDAATHFLPKPYRAEELTARLAAMLSEPAD